MRCFGEAREIASQYAALSLLRQARRSGAIIVLASGALYIAMKGRVAWYGLMQWALSDAMQPVGKVALDALEQAPNFNRWMYESIKPFLGKQMVELGAGRCHAAFYLLHPARCFGSCAAPVQAGPVDGAPRHHLRQFARLAL